MGSAIVAALNGRWYQAAAQTLYLQGQGMPYDAFDALPKTNITVANCTIAVAFAPGPIRLDQQSIFTWIETAARSVAAYYGKFPVNFVKLLIVPVEGDSVRTGTTWGYRGAAIRIVFGQHTDREALKRDWIMTHEFVHLALPDMAQNHTWLAEGLAVYIEPIARVQAGTLTAVSIWRDMPRGLPQTGDKGLDTTLTWARTYWGGALFCLLADVEIHKRTENHLGLQDAMRGVLAAGGNREADWPIAKILQTADHTVHLDVLNDLYNRMRATPVTPDLPKLWRDLGVDTLDTGIRFRDDAPLAATRDAITRKPIAG